MSMESEALAAELAARRSGFNAGAAIGNPKAQDAETKHDPSNGQFTSGSGGGSSAGENIGKGMGEHYDRQKQNEKSFPKGNTVKTHTGEIATVTGHNGPMVHTDKGEYHHTKVNLMQAGGDPDVLLKNKTYQKAAAKQNSDK